MRYALAALLLLGLAACEAPEKTPAEAEAIAAQVDTAQQEHVVPILERHQVKPETTAAYMAATRHALVGLLSGGSNWRDVLEDIAVFGFNALLGLFGIKKGAPLIARAVGFLKGLFAKKPAS